MAAQTKLTIIYSVNSRLEFSFWSVTDGNFRISDNRNTFGANGQLAATTVGVYLCSTSFYIEVGLFVFS